MASRSAGVSGTAVLFGATGIYLVYAGVKDVPLVDGIRDLLRGELPQERAVAGDEKKLVGAKMGGTVPKPGDGGGGDLGLVGNAAAALPLIRAVAPGVEIGGRAARPENPTSDHPKGLAMDVMTKDNAVAQKVINAFKTTKGAKYWIWQRRIGNISRLWLPVSYNGPNPHTDHVHLSWS